LKPYLSIAKPNLHEDINRIFHIYA
jgi:hypothetical protein